MKTVYYAMTATYYTLDALGSDNEPASRDDNEYIATNEGSLQLDANVYLAG